MTELDPKIAILGGSQLCIGNIHEENFSRALEVLEFVEIIHLHFTIVSRQSEK